MNILGILSFIEQFVVEIFDFFVKEFGGGFKIVGDFASFEKYLYW